LFFWQTIINFAKSILKIINKHWNFKISLKTHATKVGLTHKIALLLNVEVMGTLHMILGIELMIPFLTKPYSPEIDLIHML
jgi:hypothetical protein